jgi:hypothetical protein
LEAIACGCAVVGSTAGGLPEAIGPCGLTYPKLSVSDLAFRLEQLMMEPGLLNVMQKYATEHLATRTRLAIAARYLSFIADCFPALVSAAHQSRDSGAASVVLPGGLHAMARQCRRFWGGRAVLSLSMGDLKGNRSQHVSPVKIKSSPHEEHWL